MAAVVALGEGQVLREVCLNLDGLQPLDCGLWSETPPPALRARLRDPQRYQEAVCRINKVHRKKVVFRSETAQAWLKVALGVAAVLGTVGAAALLAQRPDTNATIKTVCGLLGLYGAVFTFHKHEAKRILRLLQKAVGGANALLWEQDVLIGCGSKAELLVTRVPLSACRERLGRQFNSALVKYSNEYVCGLAQRDAESAPPPEEAGHLLGAPCFCQYMLKRECCGCFC